MEEIFDIPIVLFMFKRRDKTLQILSRVSQVQPNKLYLLSDYGRNDDEVCLALETRKAVEEAIDWDCEIIKDYADKNRGVYEQIGLGAKRILESEWAAIFLEDDNLPEVGFFRFCKEMLERYKYDTRVLWICGTNYLEQYEPIDGSDYVFSQHMMPCGWASWGNKFPRYYDFNFEVFSNIHIQRKLRRVYGDSKLYKYDMGRIIHESDRGKFAEGSKYISWDYHMAATLRAHNLYGIVPKKNQIENIGVDELSEHGGTSFNNIMTRRFCGIKSFPMQFPLNHPIALLPDHRFDKLTTRIVIPPWYILLRHRVIGRPLRRILKVPENISMLSWARGILRKRKNTIKGDTI